MLNVKEIIETLSFENEEFENEASSINISNPHEIKSLIEKCDEQNIDCQILKNAISEHDKLESHVSQEEIKQVYIKLKDREENPRGTFDKAGRFYIEDYELVNVRCPSAAYPYSQMNAARTAKFVKALVEKYKPQSLKDLESVAFSRKR